MDVHSPKNGIFIGIDPYTIASNLCVSLPRLVNPAYGMIKRKKNQSLHHFFLKPASGRNIRNKMYTVNTSEQIASQNLT